MTLDEIKNAYGSFYMAMKDFGLTYNNANYWKKLGYIPINTQINIERITGGRFVASLDHCKPKDGG